jgi:hypothetical protein
VNATAIVSATSNSRAWFTSGTDAVARDVLAGSVCGIVSIAFGLSFAALIFSGPLTPWLAYGIAASFVSSSIAGLVMTAGSSLPITIAGPDSSTSAVTAALVGVVTQHLAASGASDRLLVASLVVMPMSSALTGLLLCGLGAARAGRAIRFVPLDGALEACEDAVIRAAQSTRAQDKTLQEWFTQALGTSEYAELLANHCVRMEFAAGDIMARQGDPADALHFILEGRLSVLLSSGDEQIRIRSLGPHTTVGEMGLISHQPRSATIRAETRSVLYALSLDRYERIKLENPALGQALLSYIVTVMTERLSFASRVIGVLQR